MNRNNLALRAGKQGIRPATCCAVLAAAALFLAGCNSDAGRAPKVNAPRAREALVTVLDGWKNGATIASLQTATPPIVVQDFDWMSGHTLVSYEVAGDGKDDDANLRIPVQLTMKSPAGKEIKKKVSYVVGTSPTVTVFREFGG
jgi:hypothetical protein